MYSLETLLFGLLKVIVVKSAWIDHVFVSSRIASAVFEVSALDCVSNFSDHRPIFAICQ